MKYPTTEAGWWRSEFETTCELLRAERKKIAALTAVADAARGLKRPMGDWDPAWVALWKALAALEGDDRG